MKKTAIAVLLGIAAIQLALIAGESWGIPVKTEARLGERQRLANTAAQAARRNHVWFSNPDGVVVGGVSLRLSAASSGAAACD